MPSSKGTSVRRGRPPGAEALKLDRHRLVEALLAIAEEEGADNLSMRRIAARLGVSPRLLYFHVTNKDALFDLLADAITARCPIPDSALPWRERIVQIECSLFHELLKFPGVPEKSLVRSTENFESPHARAIINELENALTESGLDGPSRSRAQSVLYGYFMGQLVVAASRLARGSEQDAEALLADFRDGLELIIKGIEAQIRPGDV